MAEYPNNSNAARNAERNEMPESQKKEINKVSLSAPAKTKKRSPLSKIGDNILSDDRGSIGSHIWNDVAVPMLKDFFANSLTDAVNIIFYGSTRRGDRRPGGTYVSYRTDYGSYSRDPRRDDPPQRRSAYDFDEFSFRTRRDAEGVLYELDNILRRYKIVSVADFYEVVDQTPPFTANHYGWTDLRQADIASGRDGYYIRMPKPAPLD